jgi:hypothetical protein
MSRTGELLQKTLIFLSAVLACGVVGLVVPLMFDRDVAGALAAELLAIVGLIVGGILGVIIIRRDFD